jgi:hypothetical protein
MRLVAWAVERAAQEQRAASTQTGSGARGIPTVTLGCGQLAGHAVAEQLDVAAFRHACQVAMRLATGT